MVCFCNDVWVCMTLRYTSQNDHMEIFGICLNEVYHQILEAHHLEQADIWSNKSNNISRIQNMVPSSWTGSLFSQLLRTSGSGIPTELSTKSFRWKKILTHPTCSSLYSSEEASMSVSFDSSSWIRAAVLPGLS